MKLFDELKRRGVVRVTIAYLAVAWLALQLAEILFPAYGQGDAAIRQLFTALLLGLPIAMVCAWFLEWTPGGIVRDSGEEDAPAPSGSTRRRREPTGRRAEPEGDRRAAAELRARRTRGVGR